MKLETASEIELLEAALQYYKANRLVPADIELLAAAFSVDEVELTQYLVGAL